MYQGAADGVGEEEIKEIRRRFAVDATAKDQPAKKEEPRANEQGLSKEEVNAG